MSRFLLPFHLSIVWALVAAADLSGVWTLSWEPDFGGTFDAYDCTFKQEHEQLTVTCRDDLPMTGEIDGQRVVVLRFKTGRDGSEHATLTGEVDEQGRTITGTWHLTEQNRDGKFVARKH
jgi:hypothetical protein